MLFFFVFCVFSLPFSFCFFFFFCFVLFVFWFISAMSIPGSVHTARNRVDNEFKRYRKQTGDLHLVMKVFFFFFSFLFFCEQKREEGGKKSPVV